MHYSVHVEICTTGCNCFSDLNMLVLCTIICFTAKYKKMSYSTVQYIYVYIMHNIVYTLYSYAVCLFPWLRLTLKDCHILATTQR